MRVRFFQERIIDFLPDVGELLRLHYEEICHDKDTLKLDPDFDAYVKLEQLGSTLLITARADEKLVGYIVFKIGPHLHYRGVVTAQEDVRFLHRDFRKGRAGIEMIKFAENAVLKRGCKLIAVRVKVAHDHGAIFSRLGFAATDIVYTKAL